MSSQRLLWLRLIVLAAFLIFLGRLAYLQLIKGKELRQASENNYYRSVSLPAPRGIIYDWKSRVLATNVSTYTAWLISGQVGHDNWNDLINRLVSIGIFPDLATANDELKEVIRQPSYLPIRLKSQISLREITRLEEDLVFLPGVYIKQEPIRYYPQGTLAAHALGYLHEISDTELNERRDMGYRLKDRIGKSGVEKAYEDSLRGVEGRDEVEVDVLGRTLEKYQAEPYIPGHPITLTINQDVQRVAETAMRGYSGAVVALDPNNGDIIALLSTPAFNPNQMSGHRSSQFQAWLNNTHAETNHATCGMYPPGSVFKIITAAAALEQKNPATVNTSFYCPGSYYGIHCWLHKGHGLLNMIGALSHSCNVYFMHLAERTGPEALETMAHRFGLGEPVGLQGLLPESSGSIGKDWKKLTRKQRKAWPLGDTLQMGIGQSEITVTPLQAARVVSVIANKGKLVYPRLVKSDGGVENPSVKPTDLKLKPSTINIIAEGLRQVAEIGTAKQLDPSLRIAGKTGTAQNPRGEDHAWFVGYAPAEQPEVAVAVLVEHGGHGGAIAAPIAEMVIRAAMRKK